MNSLITIEIRGAYGRELIYPRNALALEMCDLLRQKSFTYDQLEILKRIGFKIEIKLRELEK